MRSTKRVRRAPVTLSRIFPAARLDRVYGVARSGGTTIERRLRFADRGNAVPFTSTTTRPRRRRPPTIPPASETASRPGTGLRRRRTNGSRSTPSEATTTPPFPLHRLKRQPHVARLQRRHGGPPVAHPDRPDLRRASLPDGRKFLGEPGGSLVLNVGVGLPPPAGDDFDSAVPVGSIPFSTTMDLTQATVANDDPFCYADNGTVWLAYTADEQTRIRASLDGAGEFFDENAISAYTGVRGSLEEIGCHVRSDEDANDARITVVAPAGETVYFMVSALGSVVVHLDVAEPPPANDQIDNATVIRSLPFEDSPEASGASVETGDPAVSAPCELEAPWNRRSGIPSRPRTRSPCGRARGTLAFRRIPSCSRSSRENPRPAINSAAPSTGRLLRIIPAIVGVHVPAGQRIWFMVGLANSATGEFTLRVEIAPPPPANDDFDNALSIESLPFETSLDMFSATSAPDDPVASCGLGVLPTTWFAFELSTVREWSLNSCLGGLGPAVAAYTGTRGHLNEVACSGENAPGVAVTIESGMTVYFLVQCCPPDVELFVNAFEVPPPPNDDIRSATLISQSDLPL